MRELMACLGPLAEQLEQVLKALSQPVQPEAARVEQGNVSTGYRATDAQVRGAELKVEDPEPTDNGWALSREATFTCGVTVEQIDQLNQLAEHIKAYGDAVSASGAADFAPGTLSILGHTIFDRAVELDALVSDIYTQSLEQEARPHSVRETPPAYCAQATPWTGGEAETEATLHRPSLKLWSRSPAQLLH